MPMTEKDRAARAAYTERRHAEYWSTHDSTPLCRCGCGEHVNLDYRGRPYRYAGKNHHTKVTTSESTRKAWETRRFRGGNVSMKEFRYAAHVLKYHNAWTWTELAEAFGMPDNRLRSMLHDKRLRSVSRHRVVGFFESLTGKEIPETWNPCRWVFNELGLRWEPEKGPSPQW